uniref:CHRD domain containing protein n=1 Tax=Solibacter usitatus (strain Ellin6076) TaxID=234267 RepID=Q01ZX6_SOLUE
MRIMKLGPCFLLISAIAMAQSGETVVFRALLLPASEVPAINNSARGVADVVTSVVRDSSGQIVSGNIDILLRTALAAANTATGLNLHNAGAGQNAAIALSTGLTVANSRPLQNGADSLHIAVPIKGDNSAALASLRALLQDPAKFYLNMTSTDQPNGLMRGQLIQAQVTVLLALLNSDNVAPAPMNSGRGVGQVVAIGTRDAAGNWTTGEVYCWAAAFSDDPTLVNGFHLHLGQTGAAGAIGITVPVPAGAVPDPNGNALLGPLQAEITTSNTTQTGAFTNLFVNPSSVYLDLHTTQNSNGLVRAQLRPTDSAAFALLLDSANESAAPPAHTAAPANFTLYTLRNEDGTVAAATMLTDVNLRFPNPQQFLGLYVHDAAPLADGPISLKAAPEFSSDTGFGNYYAWTAPLANVAAVNDLLQNPENHYANLHSMEQPGGAVRAQFGSAAGRATIAAVIPANLDKAAAAIAPGGLISIFGANLAKVSGGLSGWSGQQLPVALNGAKVTVGGIPAPLVYVSPNQINAQAPLELAAGVQTVTVDNGSGVSNAFSVNVAPMAPAIFFYPVPAILKNANYSLISAGNPARAGDVLLVYATGLGKTTPANRTGSLSATDTLAQTAPVTATLGGKPTAIVYSIASPGFAGLYQVAVTVPVGVTGNVALVIIGGAATSNSVTIPVQ